MLGYSALLQGKPDLADRFFDEAVSIDVPDRTVSVNKPIEARAAFRRGNRSAAFRILRAYVDELLETDYPDLATNAAVEFINMMAIDRPPPGRGPRAGLPRGPPATSVPSLPEPSSPMPPPRSPPMRNASLTRIGHPNRGSTLGTR